MVELLLGKVIADEKIVQVKETINKNNLKLCLAVIQAGDDPMSNMCINCKKNKCLEVGVEFKLFKFLDDLTDELLINKIKELNEDKNITGMIVQLPLPSNLNSYKIINSITADKDADGLTTASMGRLFMDMPTIVPATAQAIIDILSYYKIDVAGAKVVIIGRSNLVSKPAAMMLQNKNATVTMVHRKTRNIISHTADADILIVAAGSPLLVKKDMIKSGAVVIDVGINKVNGKTCGDVDFENVVSSVGSITPVPGGVGPLTVANMIRNVMKCYNLLNSV